VTVGTDEIRRRLDAYRRAIADGRLSDALGEEQTLEEAIGALPEDSEERGHLLGLLYTEKGNFHVSGVPDLRYRRHVAAALDNWSLAISWLLGGGAESRFEAARVYYLLGRSWLVLARSGGRLELAEALTHLRSGSSLLTKPEGVEQLATKARLHAHIALATGWLHGPDTPLAATNISRAERRAADSGLPEVIEEVAHCREQMGEPRPVAELAWRPGAETAGSNGEAAVSEHARALPARTAAGGLDGLVGMAQVKEQLASLEAFYRVQRARVAEGRKRVRANANLIFMGAPGTGKTAVAGMMGPFFRSLGVVEKGHVVVAGRPELIAEYVGQTAPLVEALVQKALDGVLVIDQIDALAADEGAFVDEAFSTLAKLMEANRGRLVVIMTGSEQAVSDLRRRQPGLVAAFRQTIRFPGYTDSELALLFEHFAAESDYDVAPAANARLALLLERLPGRRDPTFANAKVVRTIFEDTIAAQARRVAGAAGASLSLIEGDDVGYSAYPALLTGAGTDEVIDEALRDLESLVGLAEVKAQVQSLVNRARMRQKRAKLGLVDNDDDFSYHLVFEGNPGTGKTTVARILARVYQALGILARASVLEVQRSEMVAGYVGQTAVKTSQVVDRALDSILFIDEAYDLVRSDDDEFGHESLANLLKRMEDERDRLVVIVAGYPRLMRRFLSANPGLHSRFSETISFPNYSADELLEIFRRTAAAGHYELDPQAVASLAAELRRVAVSPQSANGRTVRNLFQDTLTRQADRLGSVPDATAEDLSLIVAADVASADLPADEAQSDGP
jgi:SpoVK/Ycf46/Vps4 family AAA+-type ATPase